MASVPKTLGEHVCVVGTGMIGLVAMKNLLEQGLQVTALERNDWIGGTWHPSAKVNQTTALPITTKNTSKQVSSYTDFPYPAEYPTHPPAKDVDEYFNSYAKHFDLMKHVQFGKDVVKVERDEANSKWIVYTKDANSPDAPLHAQSYDRLCLATGLLNVPHVPKVKGIEKFEGDAMHSRQFKDPTKYRGKRVIVVGIGATGADTTSFLKQSGTGKIYLSHRGQFYLLPRMVNGKAFDHSMSRRASMIMRCVASFSPRLCAILMRNALVGMRKKAFPWLQTHSAFAAPRALETPMHRIPLFSDDLAENLRNGSVEDVGGIQEVTGPHTVVLADGTILEDIDAMIFCSGYHYDLSLVSGAADPTNPSYAPDNYRRIKSTRYYDPDNPFPRLYRGFISERYPDSLAFLGHMLIMKAPFICYDLVTMSLASLWSGHHPLPSRIEMEKDINTQYNFLVSNLNRAPIPHPGFRFNGLETYHWLNEAAGTGVSDRLGCFSWEAWKLWWNDRKLYSMLMDGPDTPAVYRLFDTGRGRKPWKGARKQIEATNEEIRLMGEIWKEKQAKSQ